MALKFFTGEGRRLFASTEICTSWMLLKAQKMISSTIGAPKSFWKITFTPWYRSEYPWTIKVEMALITITYLCHILRQSQASVLKCCGLDGKLHNLASYNLTLIYVRKTHKILAVDVNYIASAKLLHCTEILFSWLQGVWSFPSARQPTIQWGSQKLSMQGWWEMFCFWQNMYFLLKLTLQWSQFQV